jgi:hypothetical protein
MAFNNDYIVRLNEINALIGSGKLEGEDSAIEKFTEYSNFIQHIGNFDLTNWNVSWRKCVWLLGEQFKKINPNQFITAIDKKIKESSNQSIEVFEFIRSEIAFNFLPDKECKKQLLALIEKYPLNPEFRHTLGHYYSRENLYLESIGEYKLALTIDRENEFFFDSLFTRDQEYLSFLVENGEYSVGKKYVKEVIKNSEYMLCGINVYDTFIAIGRRFEDHLIFQKKLKTIESEFREKLKLEIESERKKLFEILAFFSAIIAFILATVSIGKNFSFHEAIYFVIALGIILILFVTSLSILCTSSKKEILKDHKFWVLIIGLILIVVFILAI